MASRNVVWTNTTANQRRAILKYWTKRNGSTTYAKKIIDLSEKHTNSISKYPLSFVKSGFKDTRIAAMGHFSIFYKVTENEILVTAFWDNRQSPKRLLKLLKSNSK